MENATKAILMAAGVLIGVMILSLAAYLFVSFGGTAQTIQDRIDMGYMSQFNNKFLAYQAKNTTNDSKNPCTIYDIISVVNLANEFNDTNGFKYGDSDYISVYIGSNANDTNATKIVNDKTKASFIDGEKLDVYTYGTTSPYGGVNEADPTDPLSREYKLKGYNCYCHINQETERMGYIVFVPIP